MLRRAGSDDFLPISWDEALEKIARRIRDSSPERLAFFMTSRGITNETYYVAQKVARFLGTNNVDNAARLCHSPSTAAMKPTLGVAAATCSYTDWLDSELIVFFGSNPANDQPVSVKYLREAKKRGAKIVVVNPYHEPGMRRYWVPSKATSALFGTDLMDHWFAVKQGGDIAFIWGAIKSILEQGMQDAAFVGAHTTGFEAIRETAAALDWADIEEQAGLNRTTIEAFAELVGAARTGVFVWSMGITQHPFGTDGVQSILNLGLLRGFLGRDGCGLMPIRGHSGVQGGAEMGAYATAFPGGKPIDSANAAALAEAYGFDVPDAPGLATTAMVHAAHRGELDLLYCVGGNFLRTLGDPDYVREAVARVPLRVYQDILLTNQMFIPPTEGDGEVLLLPAQTRYEQPGGGTETSTERRVIYSPQIPRQVGEARAEWQILRGLAAATYPDRIDVFGCEDAQAIRDEIARVIPMYNGIQDLRERGDQFQYGGRHLCPGGVCPTEDGRARMTAPPLPSVQLGDDEYWVSTRRGKQFNTLIYADRDPITGADRDAVILNTDDAETLGVTDGDALELTSAAGRFRGRAKIDRIAPRCLQVHWPEANTLIDKDVIDRRGGIPDYNAKVKVEVIA
jgi:molybdopterin-dependent oxidoreductase alpha subunit